MTKLCPKCGLTKDSSAFTKARNRRDGLYNFCKDCTRPLNQKSYQRHREKRLAETRAYALRPEIQRVIRQRNKEGYWKNRDEHLRKAKAWFRNNRDRRRAYIKQWNAANRDKVRAYQNAYKAKKRGAGRASVTAAAWELIKMTFRNRCVYCGGALARLEQDHVVALARGGEHVTDNVVPACRHCNATKIYNPAPKFWWIP